MLTHTFGYRSDSDLLLESCDQFFTDFFFPYLEKENIKNIIHLGDVFDRRQSVNFSTFEKSKKMFFDPVKNAGIQLSIILGNHDVFFRNTNDVNSPSLLLQDYNFDIYVNTTEVNYAGKDFLFVPWINPENEEESLKMIATSKATHLFGHLAIHGCQHIQGHVEQEGLEQKLFEKYSKVFSGHFHHRAEVNDIMYVGCPYEMQWSDFGNQKGFHILDTDDMSVTFIANPFKYFKRIYYDDVNHDPRIVENLERCYIKLIVKNKSDPANYERFIEDLNKRKIASLMVIEESMAHGSEVPDLESGIEDTVTFMKKYIDAMDGKGLDKQKLTDMMVDLYLKANEMED